MLRLEKGRGRAPNRKAEKEREFLVLLEADMCSPHMEKSDGLAAQNRKVDT